MEVGGFITLLERMKLKNSVYEDLKWQKDYIPHHKQEMEQLIDALGKRRVAWGLSSISYYSQKRCHRKLGALALCLLVLSPILYLQIKGGKKQWQETLVLISLSLALSTFAAYCWWPKLISLFFHKEIEIYKQGVKMIEQNIELKDYCIVGQSDTRKKTAEEYIESIKGAVSAAEFEMHVKCLMSLEIGFSDYEYKLRNDKRLKGDQGIVRDFLNYVKEKRLNSTGLDQDVSKLHYCSQARDKGDISYSHNWLFRVTRQLLWKVIPYEFIKGKKTAMEHFSKRVKGIDDNLTLREALEVTCVLNHEDDVDELLRSLKVLLAAYHPDKNKAEKAREAYEQVEKVYRAVSTILEKYERLIGARIYCDLKEFLEWKLRDISDEAVYEHIVSMGEPQTYIYKRKSKEYEEHKKAMLDIKDGILKNYRSMIGKIGTLLEKIEEIADYKQLINGIEIINGVEVKKVSEEEMAELKQDRDKATETKKQLKKEIENHKEKIEKSLNRLRSKMKEASVVCKDMKGILTKEIESRKKGLSDESKDSYRRYLEEKQVANLERLLKGLSEEEQDIEDVLKATDSWTEWWHKKKRNVKNKVKNNTWTVWGILEGTKKILSRRSIVEEHSSYIREYENLSHKYQELKREIKKYYVERIDNDKGSKFLLYRKVLVPIAEEAGNENSYNCSSKHEYIYERAENIEKKQEELKERAEELEEKYKTQKEIEKKRESDLKENKEKLTHDKEKIKSLKKQLAEELAKIEETGIKVEAAEAKIEEERAAKEQERAAKEQERAAREEAEAKAEKAEARSKAIRNMFSEAAIRGIVDKVVSDQRLQKFFIDQFISIVLYEGLKDKCQNLAHEYVQLREELTCEVIVDYTAQNPEEMSKEDVFERMLNLVGKFDKLDEKLKKLDEEYAQEKPTFENEKIEEFKRDTLSRVVQARKAAISERLFVEDEKVAAEEMVERIQILAAPSLTLNDTSLEHQAGPSWKI